MNRKKSKRTMSLGMILLLVTCGVIVSASGVFYVVVKNKQVQTRRDIEKVEKRIDEHKVCIRMHRSDIEEHLGVFKLKDRLEKNRTKLVSIPPDRVEVIYPDAGYVARPEVAPREVAQRE